MAKKKSKKIENDTPGQYFALPYTVIKSDRFQNCKPIGIQLLCTLFLQYNGKNNGDIACNKKTMNTFGWSNTQQWNLAMNSLLESQLIMLTRQGGRNQCNLFAFTWLRIHECLNKAGKHKLDVAPTTRPNVIF